MMLSICIASAQLQSRERGQWCTRCRWWVGGGEEQRRALANDSEAKTICLDKKKQKRRHASSRVYVLQNTGAGYTPPSLLLGQQDYRYCPGITQESSPFCSTVKNSGKMPKDKSETNVWAHARVEDDEPHLPWTRTDLRKCTSAVQQNSSPEN